VSEEKGQEAPEAEAETEVNADADAEAEPEVKADAEEEVEAPEDEPPPAEPEDAFVAAPGILGRKVGMTQIFSADGNRLPVTIIEAGPCVVVQVKTRERDGTASSPLACFARYAWRSLCRMPPRAAS
jgi:hypothetical protein